MNQTAWVKLADGVEVIRHWETPDGPKKPEIAILRLSGEMYKDFENAPQAFVERHKVFPFKLRKVEHHRVPTTEKKARTGGDPPQVEVVVCLHNQYSITGCVSGTSL